MRLCLPLALYLQNADAMAQSGDYIRNNDSGKREKKGKKNQALWELEAEDTSG